MLLLSAALLGSAASPTSAAAKCRESIGHPVLPGYVLIVDGKVVGEYEMNDGSAKAALPAAGEVASVAVVCIDAPQDGARGARRAATVIVTHDGLPQAFRAALAELVEAQRSYRERHGIYASDLEALGTTPTRAVPIDMRVGPGGWSAVVRIGTLEPVCQVAVGAAAAEMRLRDGVIRCGVVRE
jgi:hypothetical protein